jgi:hypothetical protein
MAKYGDYQRRKVQKEKDLAVELYKEGLTMRAVGLRINRSHTFVSEAVKAAQNDLSTPHA